MSPDFDDETLGSLERARERLYSAKAPSSSFVPRTSAPTKKTPHAWQDAPASPEPPHRHVRLALTFFWVAAAFFVIASSIATYLLFSGDRTVSTANVNVSVQGPTSIAGGDTVPLHISITNNNPTAIENTTLTLSFPQGTRSSADLLTPLTHDIENIGTLAPGAHIERTIKAVLFGGQGATLTIPVNLQFKTKGSNAVFEKNQTYSVSVIATPLSVSLNVPPDAINGQPFTLTATVRSNASAPLAGVILQAAYPIGFTPLKSSVKPIGNNFPLGTLAPGATSTVRIVGKLTGQTGEERAFRFTVGTAESAQGPSLAVAYMTQSANVTISNPFLATTLSINGGPADNAVVAPGAQVTATLNWTNTLSVPVTNAQITVGLSGNELNPGSVQSSDGQYQSANKTVVFNRDTDPALSLLLPGASGSGTFSFSVLPAGSASTTPGGANDVTLSVQVSGQYPGQGNLMQTGIVSLSKSIKVTTALALNAYALYTGSSFSNTGPIPPVANQKTTYTVVWKVHNTTNDIAGASVTANLPTGVQFTGPASSSDGSLTYDAGARAITWNIGNLAAGATRSIEFPVSFVPSISQRSTTPTLVGPGTLSAFDRYAQVSISQTMPAVTINLSHDPTYGTQPGSGTVR